MPRALLLLCFALALPASAQTLDKIKKSGTLTLGYVDNAVPFAYADEKGEPQGYSVDLCRAVAASIGQQLKLPNVKTRWVKLTLQNRIAAVQKREVDIECGTATWTLSRQRLVDFSLITFVDGGSVLTKAQDEKLRTLGDFDGRRIAVIRGTTTEKALRAALERVLVKAEVVTVAKRDEGLALLRAGKVDGFASDRTTLIGVVIQRSAGDAFRLLDADFSIEQYALMLPRNDADFRLAVNRALARLYRTNEIQPIYERWLGPLGPPSILLSATYFIQGLSE